VSSALKEPTSSAGKATASPSCCTNLKVRIMNLFLLLKASSNVFFHIWRRSDTFPSDSENRRTAWSVASPMIFRSCKGRCSVAASKLPALQSPAMTRSCEIAFDDCDSACRRSISSLAWVFDMISRPMLHSVTYILFYEC